MVTLNPNKMNNNEQYEEMEMPTPCQHCGKIFDLNDGVPSDKWYPNHVICEPCGDKEEQEMERDKEVEDLKNNISDAEITIKDSLERLKELGVSHPQEPQVKSAEENRLKRITLCGSTKFKKEFEAVNRQLSMEGHTVYSVAFFGHADNIPLTDEQKQNLDTVHKRKIDNSDGIFVLDVDGYIGSSTKSEIEYAERTGKFVKYLSGFPDLKYICDTSQFKSEPTEELKGLKEECQSLLDHNIDLEEELSKAHREIDQLEKEIERLKSEPKAWTPPTDEMIEKSEEAPGPWFKIQRLWFIKGQKSMRDQYLNSQRKDNP